MNDPRTAGDEAEDSTGCKNGEEGACQDQRARDVDLHDLGKVGARQRFKATRVAPNGGVVDDIVYRAGHCGGGGMNGRFAGLIIENVGHASVAGKRARCAGQGQHPCAMRRKVTGQA